MFKSLPHLPGANEFMLYIDSNRHAYSFNFTAMILAVTLYFWNSCGHLVKLNVKMKAFHNPRCVDVIGHTRYTNLTRVYRWPGASYVPGHRQTLAEAGVLRRPWHSSDTRLSHPMMTSSNGNIFCATGPLCGEFADHLWIPLTKASDAELLCFLWSAPEQTLE